MSAIFHIKDISTLNQMLNQESPKHPFISIVDFSKVGSDVLKQSAGVKLTTSFYCILLKTLNVGSLKYGRGFYDFQEGSLFFMSPNQVFGLDNPVENECIYGWGIYFHPDLLQNTSLYSKLKDYSFFEYSSKEALHLSKDEKQTLTNIVTSIDTELKKPIDKHSRVVIASSIELLLNHCMRFYDRQFATRHAINNDAIERFEHFLNTYFNSNLPQEKGLPSVKQCAEEVNLSVNYLTDLLRKETGKNTQEHIHYHIIKEAKSKLSTSNQTISEIAYALGFNYPQYFSKLFKKNMGITPLEFKNRH